MRIDYSERAESDLDAAIDNLLRVSRSAAARFAEDHDACLANLLAFPRLGRPLGSERFSLPIGTWGYRFVYELREETIRILTIENARRQG